jgi:AraC-like DNA-binding protein
MDVRRALPHPLLRAVVRSFEERRLELGAATLTWPVAARPHLILNIHLAETYRVRIDGGPLGRTPEIGVVGPQTHRRAHVHMTGSIHVFNILFQPTGLHRLAGVDMRTLVDQDPAAGDVMGAPAVALGDAVRAAPDFAGRVAAAQRWLGKMMEAGEPDPAIDRASSLLVAERGHPRVNALVRQSGLSASRLQRRFALRVGMTPKLFARTVRFDAALVARRNDPDRTWTDIVHDLGYFDQAHFIRECRAFAGLPPTGLVGEWENVFFPAGDQKIQA